MKKSESLSIPLVEQLGSLVHRLYWGFTRRNKQIQEFL